MRVLSRTVPAAMLVNNIQQRTMVNLYGPAFLTTPPSRRKTARSQQVVMMNSSSLRIEETVQTPPPDPSTLLSETELQEQANMVRERKYLYKCVAGLVLSYHFGTLYTVCRE